MMKGLFQRAAVAALLGSMALSAHALLEGRNLDGIGGADAYFDPGVNGTWLRSAGSTLYTYEEAAQWAASLDIAGFTGWRLPTTPLKDATCNDYNPFLPYSTGLGCRDGEMSHLWNKDSHGITPDSPAPFDGVTAGGYWSSTTTKDGAQFAFDFATGETFVEKQPNNNLVKHYAWAIYHGDVAGIPEPGTWAMLLGGMAGVAFVARRRRL